MTYSLLVGIVLHDKGELITKAAVEAGSFGGTVLMGRGLSSSRFAAALGIESSKDVVYILTDDEKKQTIFNAIVSATQNEKQHFGCLFCVDAGFMIKTGTISGGDGPELPEPEKDKLPYKVKVITEDEITNKRVNGSEIDVKVNNN